MNIVVKGRLETASTRGFTHLRGLKNLNFLLAHVRVAFRRKGGLCLYSREFHSLGLKLTRMTNAVSLLILMSFLYIAIALAAA